MVADPYRWLEEGDEPTTLRWIEEQRAHYAPHRDGWTGRGGYCQRITELLDHTSWSVPAVFDDHLLTTRSDGLVDHPQLVVEGERVRTLLDPRRSVALDLRELRDEPPQRPVGRRDPRR